MGKQPQVNHPVMAQVTHQVMAQPPRPQPAPTGKPTSPSDDLLQLDAAFGSSLSQPPASTGFSASTAFPPSQPFPPMQQTAPVGFSASPWGPPVSAPNAGRLFGELKGQYRTP